MEDQLRQVASSRQITPDLRSVLEDMERCGVPRYDWPLLRPLVRLALEQSLDSFRVRHPGSDPVEQGKPAYDAQKQRLLSALDLFEGAPFTLQRLCELMLRPGSYYSSVAKLIFGLEKLLSVSSVLEVSSPVSASLQAPASASMPMEGVNSVHPEVTANTKATVGAVQEEDEDAEMSESEEPGMAASAL
mmetsp:Transcript_13862/g.26914  ORF Transcript_13862/g.26914 Transcript_13862/m.26914 type:complete len:189 (-) Transcript_13862:420-986(-)|eukprot:CAMPEP_0171494600 /NCGR_PEP_ID=MMETSP0958-20121227/5647_1 /TAXON_ID=87120 /ORGANISM="Aurantiochytrium limacinum, Strain ATCCMYA-1381" /LENGTH=188 /DNA_ID=CAMNT_0012028431 /DNA_START=82 /DNA_END=648 /DNA_ORIENTATION=+